MTLGEMRQVLASRGIQLTKSLGQNFLHDANQLRRIADAAALAPTEVVLEVGPGLGPLTELLVTRSHRVFAIEKDARLVAFLRERFALVPGFELIHADAMDLARPEAVEAGDGTGVAGVREHLASGAWKLVSNLPYSVASPLLVDLAWSPFRPSRMVVTLQLEVARRLAAKPRTPEYGALTLLVQLDYEVPSVFKIKAGCFFPAPDVDSACVTLVRRARPLLEGRAREIYWRLVKGGFGQRRKMMLKNLKSHWAPERLAVAFEGAGIDACVRAEELGLAEFVALTCAMMQGESEKTDA
jgi:16S rRNA (adenine1518-N6/adenine1519-N6)-dimethyltransferase